MLRRSATHRNQAGQALPLALVFILFFGIVMGAIFASAGNVAAQHVQLEAITANHSSIEGAALLGAVDASHRAAAGAGCSAGASPTSAKLTMQSGDTVSYTAESCDPGTSANQSLAGQCTLCLLGPSSPNGNAGGPALNLDDATVTVAGPVAIDGPVRVDTTGVLTSKQVSASNPYNPFVGCSDSSCLTYSGRFSPPPSHITPVSDPLHGLTVPAPQGDCTSIDNPATPVIEPGVYCSITLTQAGTPYTLDSGVYTIEGGLTVSGGATLQSASGGVILYFTCPVNPGACGPDPADDEGGWIEVSGDSSVSLAPIPPGTPGTANPDDVVIYFDPGENAPYSDGSATSCGDSSILCVSSGGALHAGGTVYAPSGQLDVTGDTSVVNDVVSGALPGDVVLAALSASSRGSLDIVEGLPPAGGYCWVYDDAPVGDASSTSPQGRALVASASCLGGGGVVSLNYSP